ncbi:hypothetical protein Tco_0035451, partial [Tanacetum coccineum]
DERRGKEKVALRDEVSAARQEGLPPGWELNMIAARQEGLPPGWELDMIAARQKVLSPGWRTMSVTKIQL